MRHMNIHLHHAQMQALNAAQQMSGAAWAAKMTGTDMETDYIREARNYLAKAAAELNLYEAKRTYKPEAA